MAGLSGVIMRSFILWTIIPLALIAGAILRINLISLVYLVFMLIVPLLPTPTAQFKLGHTGRFLKCVMIFSALACIAHIIFHVTLLALPPYGHMFHNCTRMERIVREIGFQTLDHASPVQMTRLIVPDILVLIVSFLVFLLCHKMKPYDDVDRLALMHPSIAAPSSGLPLASRKTLIAAQIKPPTPSSKLNDNVQTQQDNQMADDTIDPITDAQLRAKFSGTLRPNAPEIERRRSSLIDLVVESGLNLFSNPATQGANTTAVSSKSAMQNYPTKRDARSSINLSKRLRMGTSISSSQRITGPPFIAMMCEGALFILLGLCGIIYPSLPALLYFALFLGSATAWACCQRFIFRTTQLFCPPKNKDKTTVSNNPNTMSLDNLYERKSSSSPSDIKYKLLMALKFLLLIYVAVHILLLYIYQFETLQIVLPPQHLASRVMGFTAIVHTNCTVPHEMNLYPVGWDVYINPALLLFLYWIICMNIKISLALKNFESKNITMDTSGNNPPTSRRPSRIAMTAKIIDKKLHDGSGNDTPPTEYTVKTTTNIDTALNNTNKPTINIPIISTVSNENNLKTPEGAPKAPPLPQFSTSTPVLPYSNHSNITVLKDENELIDNKPLGSVVKRKVHHLSDISNNPINGDDDVRRLPSTVKATQFRDNVIGTSKSDTYALMNEKKKKSFTHTEGRQSTLQKHRKHWTKKISPLYYIFAALVNVIIRQTYVISLILMMVWAITYHSWLTFVFLIWACIVWITPNSRTACLYSSPFFVAYAMILILLQYIYGLKLTNSELPSGSYHDFPLTQFGLIKYRYPCLPLALKTIYTCLFWITMRQFIIEKKEANVTKVVSIDGQHSQFIRGSLKPSDIASQDGTRITSRLGDMAYWLCVKYWILICCGFLLFMGISSSNVVLYRIGYVMFFVFFLIVFQIAYRVWRLTMYAFWLFLIGYSMIILILIYTYQFENFPEFWHNRTRLSYEFLRDVGLEQYDTKMLFVRLFTPTAFIVIIILQVHYFHKPFMEWCDVEKRATVSLDSKDDLLRLRASERRLQINLKEKEVLVYYFYWFLGRLAYYWRIGARYAWRAAHIHCFKLVALALMFLAIYEPQAVNVPFVILVVIGLGLSPLQTLVSCIASIWVGCLIISKMSYQLSYFKIEYFVSNCTGKPGVNTMVDNALWLGYYKVPKIAPYIKGYLCLLFLLAFQKIVRLHDRKLRNSLATPPPMTHSQQSGGNKTVHITSYLKNVDQRDPGQTSNVATSKVIPPHLTTTSGGIGVQSMAYTVYEYMMYYGILFPGINRRQADLSVTYLLKYLVNFCFFKFGIEITLMSIIATIGLRWDAWSVIYSVWLGILLFPSRKQLAMIWPFYVMFLIVVIPLQYLSTIGMPPGLCLEYPWTNSIKPTLRNWLFLPDFIVSPSSYKLSTDFFQLLFATCQLMVFKIDYGPHSDMPPSPYALGSSTATAKANTDDTEGGQVTPDYESPHITSYNGLLGEPKHHASIFTKGLEHFKSFSTNLATNIRKGKAGAWATHKKSSPTLLPTSATSRGSLDQGLDSVRRVSGGLGGELKRTESTRSKSFHFLFDRKHLHRPSFFGRSAPTYWVQDYEGGSNREIWKLENQDIQNPIPDYVTHTRTLLDKLKFAFFSYSYWITLTIILITATNRVSLFCMGYLIASFFFLWYGNELFLKPLKTIQHFWTFLIAYNFCVIFIKAFLQVIGCVYMKSLEGNLCWLVQLLSIACLKAGFGTSRDLNVSEECTVPVEQAGILWDGICFAFLIMQKRIFGSFYFKHIITEIYAQQLLASRGAELVNQIKWKEVNEQEKREIEVMQKIKKKMEQIKNQNLKMQRKLTSEPNEHFQAIRSGDYYMFDDVSDEDSDNALAELEYKEPEPLEGDEASTGIGPIELLNVALTKGGIKGAVQEGRQREQSLSLSREGSIASTSKNDEYILTGAGTRPTHGGGGRQSRISILEPIQSSDDEDEPEITNANPRQPAIVTSAQDTSERQIVLWSRDQPNRNINDDGNERPPPYNSNTDNQNIDNDVNGEDQEGEKTGNGICAKIHDFFHFMLLFFYGLLESATQQLNRISRDYRYIANILSYEKGQRKEEERQRRMQTQIPETIKSVEIPMDTNRLSLQNGTEEMNDDLGWKTPYKTYETFTQDETAQLKPDRSIVIKFLTALYYVFISRSELVCYFLVVLNMLQTASILAMPPPFMVFLWGTLSIPRPSKTFWVSLITYVEAVVIIKYLFQFGFFPWVGQERAKNPLWPPRIIGIEKKQHYAVYDLVLLLVLFFHRSILKSLGLWKDNIKVRTGSRDYFKTMAEDQNGAENTSISKSENTPILKDKNMFSNNGNQNGLRQRRNNNSNNNINNKMEQINPGFQSDSPRTTNVSVAQTSVTLSSSNATTPTDLINTSTTNHGVANLNRNNNNNNNNNNSINSNNTLSIMNGEDINNNNTLQGDISTTSMLPKKAPLLLMTCEFSHYFKTFWNFYDKVLHPQFRVTVDVYAPMFLCDFITFLIVVFGYSAFGSGTPEDGDVTSYIKQDKIPIPFLIMLVVQFALIIVDRALFLRKNLLGKLVFQFILVIVVHIWMFFLLPAFTDNEFYNNIPARLWYFSKCCYFLLSSYQIRSGYPTRILGNFLTKKYNYSNLILFKGFSFIPFLWELRTIMDWMWTDTTLTMFYWIKLEDIYANIFVLKCWRRSEVDYPTPRGVKKPSCMKYLLGGSLLFVLIIIIWFPLVLFALTNQVGSKNLPYDCTMQISIGGYVPLFRMSARNQFIKPFTENEYRLLMERNLKNKAAQVFLSNYEVGNVLEISLLNNSTDIWTISPPSLNTLKEVLLSNNTVEMRIMWSFTRSTSSKLVEPTVSDENIVNLEPGTKSRAEFAEMLRGNFSKPILIPRAFPKYVRIPAKDKPSYVRPLVPNGVISFRDITIKLQHQIFEGTRVHWWEVREIPMETPGSLKYYKPGFITIIGFSDLVFYGAFSFFAQYGIIGMYVSLVLVIGRFVRSFVSGLDSRIMFDELPNVDRVLQLCLDIYLVRESGEFKLEEELFAKLIFLYRSPETLIKWTKEKIT